MSKPKLTEQDFVNAAQELNCDVPAIKAVCEVEAPKGGFLPDDRPTILFERHKFHKFTGGRFSAEHPDISSAKAGGYGPAGAHQWRRFSRAFALDPKAAMKSCSWGKFQIMGFNFAAAGFKTLDAFIDAMKVSEGEQLKAFVNIIKSFSLEDELRAHQWSKFASGYNGANYKINKYDVKLAAAHKKHSRDAGVTHLAVGSSVIDDVELDDDITTDSNAAPEPHVAHDDDDTQAAATSTTSEPVVAAKPPIDPTAIVEVKKTEAPPQDNGLLSGIRTHYAAVAGFVTTGLGGAISFVSSKPAALIYGFFGAAVVIVVIYIWSRTYMRNKENDRQLERERMAHELTLAQIKTASDQHAYTVAVTK